MSSSMVCVDGGFVMRLLVSGASETRVVALSSEWHEAGCPVRAAEAQVFAAIVHIRR